MFPFFKRKSQSAEEKPQITTESVSNPVGIEQAEGVKTFWQRLRGGLGKTARQWTRGVGALFMGPTVWGTDFLEDLEEQLLLADVGVSVTQRLVERVKGVLAGRELGLEPQAVGHLIQTELYEVLKAAEEPLHMTHALGRPFVILMVGVNGAGKTTTIGKLAAQYKAQGLRVLVAAGDTFRAGAIDQLKVWAERNEIPIVMQNPGADSASVIYDAYQSCHAKKIDVLIADTAGRLHTQNQLMQELIKIKRVLSKLDENCPQETMLVLDAGMGQNALEQAKQFHKALCVTGISLTKLDGTAKGGVAFALASELKIPIRYLGVGEGIGDLQIFSAATFVEALFCERAEAE